MSGLRRGRLPLVIGFALTVASCGSGPGTQTPSPPGGGAALHSSLPAPPADLEAAALVRSAQLSSVLPSVSGLEDDGGITTALGPATAFVSLAATQTTFTHFVITLASFASTSAASQAYMSAVSNFTVQPPLQLTGVGSSAAADAPPASCGATPTASCERALAAGVGSGVVDVLTGSQVLTVVPTPTIAGDMELGGSKSGGTSVLVAEQQVIDVPAQAAARALGAKMTGQAATASFEQVPPDGIDACAYSTTAMASTLKTSPVSSQPLLSDMAPATECLYTTSQGTFDVYAVTAEQLAAAIPPTTVGTLFDQTIGAGPSASGATSAVFVNGPVQVGGDLGEDAQLSLSIQDPAKDGVLISIANTESGSFGDPDKYCEDVILPLAKGLIEIYDQRTMHLEISDEVNNYLIPEGVAAKLIKWCYTIETNPK